MYLYIKFCIVKFVNPKMLLPDFFTEKFWQPQLLFSTVNYFFLQCMSTLFLHSKPTIFITRNCFANVQQHFTSPCAVQSCNQKVLSVSLHTLLHSSNEQGQTRRPTSASQTKLKQMLHIRHAPVHV